MHNVRPSCGRKSCEKLVSWLPRSAACSYDSIELSNAEIRWVWRFLHNFKHFYTFARARSSLVRSEIASYLNFELSKLTCSLQAFRWCVKLGNPFSMNRDRIYERFIRLILYHIIYNDNAMCFIEIVNNIVPTRGGGICFHAFKIDVRTLSNEKFSSLKRGL